MKLGNELDSLLRGQPWNQTYEFVMARVTGQVADQTSNLVRAPISYQVWSQVLQQVHLHLKFVLLGSVPFSRL